MTAYSTYEQLTLLTRAMDQFGANMQACGRMTKLAADGWCWVRISDEIAKRFDGFFLPTNRRPFFADDCRPTYLRADLDESVVQQLNKKNVFFGPATADAQAAFVEFMTGFAPAVELELGHHFQIVNVRAWETLPDGDFGPTAWHTDAFSTFANKMMIYPAPMNAENGTLEIYDRQGVLNTLETDCPACVLFDNATLLHRGRPGKIPRRAIEVQTIPAHHTKIEYVYAGQNARVPLNFAPEIEASLRQRMYVRQKPPFHWKQLIPQPIKQAIKDVIRPRAAVPAKITVIRKPITNFSANLNIGGGAHFEHPGWINLEAATGPHNLIPFDLTPTCIFPVRSGTIQRVYSSHCLEHLDDATVRRVLTEAHRVISRHGTMVIKIPDFDAVLEHWKAKDHAYFKDQWHIESVVHTWADRGVYDNIDSRAAFIFCGFWNSQWGDHFKTRKHTSNPNAYHGPVRNAGFYLREDKLCSPHKISHRLVDAARVSWTGITFNHQNAWSLGEFTELLKTHDFSLLSISADEVARKHADIPDIDQHRNISAYYEAVPNQRRK